VRTTGSRPARTSDQARVSLRFGAGSRAQETLDAALAKMKEARAMLMIEAASGTMETLAAEDESD
jgi:hypothetical protein